MHLRKFRQPPIDLDHLALLAPTVKDILSRNRLYKRSSLASIDPMIKENSYQHYVLNQCEVTVSADEGLHIATVGDYKILLSMILDIASGQNQIATNISPFALAQGGMRYYEPTQERLDGFCEDFNDYIDQDLEMSLRRLAATKVSIAILEGRDVGRFSFRLLNHYSLERDGDGLIHALRLEIPDYVYACIESLDCS